MDALKYETFLHSHVYIILYVIILSLVGTLLVQPVQEQPSSRTFRKRTRSRGQSLDRYKLSLWSNSEFFVWVISNCDCLPRLPGVPRGIWHKLKHKFFCYILLCQADHFQGCVHFHLAHANYPGDKFGGSCLTLYMYLFSGHARIWTINLFPYLRHLKLNAEQKCDIAQRELEELKEDIEKLKDESERILDNYKVHVHLVISYNFYHNFVSVDFRCISNVIVIYLIYIMHPAVCMLMWVNIL